MWAGKGVNPVRIVRRYLAKADPTGEYRLPPDHLFGMPVPKGGSSCANCRFADGDGKHCGNNYFQDWRQSLGHTEDPGLLPAPADEYCCDVFAARGQLRTASTLRAHLGLAEHEPYSFAFENVPAENSVRASMPGDDISDHPANIYANNPFMNRNPLVVRRALKNGSLTDPKLKQAAFEYLDFVAKMTGWNVLGDATTRAGQRY